jgi:DNA-3-methyladenine glycosylase I
VIRQKWPDFQRAFDGFQVHRVAAYGEDDLERLLADPGIVRNRRKVMATIENARTMVDLADEHGSFHGYLRTLDSLSYAQKRKRLVDQFHSLGPTGLFVLLWMVDEPVPDWEERNS